jgi:branched-chain amino acid transport system substrate-binding protein
MKKTKTFGAMQLTFGFALYAALSNLVWAQLRIGQPSSFTGSVAAGVKENTDGAKLYLDSVNAQGGIYGKKVELISMDDKFDPKLTPVLARDLITQRGVLALFLNRGTPHTQALLPLLTEFKVPLVGPSTGAMLLHEPVNPWVFNVRATYQREAAKAIEHLASIGVTRIAVLETDDSFGADSAVGALKGFAKVRLNPVLQEKFPRENPDFTALASRVHGANTQAMMVIGSASNIAKAVRSVRATGSQAQVVTLSNNASNGFIKQMGEHARGVIVTQVFPNERSVAFALIKEAQGLAKAKGLDSVSPAMIEGFAAAKVLVEGLRRAGPNPTSVRLRDALENIRNFNIGGLTISYSPTDHTGLDFADLSIVDVSGRFRR